MSHDIIRLAERAKLSNEADARRRRANEYRALAARMEVVFYDWPMSADLQFNLTLATSMLRNKADQYERAAP